MYSIANVNESVKKFTFSDTFVKYTKVEIDITDETYVESGEDTGSVLRTESPWATKQVADNVLEQVNGFAYHPYTAKSVVLDPAVELGDGVFVETAFSGIYVMETRFGKTHVADISAPSEEEIDHEFPYKPKETRKIDRRISKTESELAVQADRISAKVSSIGGNSDKSFGWSLTDGSWKITANDTDVLTVTKNGLSLTGKITAKTGEIGGFAITSKYLSLNGLTWSNDATSGIYIGERGIKLGQNFKVDVGGRLIAESGVFRGSVSAGNVRYGGDDGLFNGAGLGTNSVTNSKIAPLTISTGSLSSGISTSLGYANFANDVFNGYDTATLVQCRSMVFDTHTVARRSMTVDGSTVNYLAWI